MYMYIYIYIYTQLYIYIYIYILYIYIYTNVLINVHKGSKVDSESHRLPDGLGTNVNGSLPKSTGANGRKQFSANTYMKLVLFLQRSPNISGNLREFTGECNLGIL